PKTPSVTRRRARRGGAPQGEPLDDLATPTRVTRAKPVAAPTVEAAIDRLNKYVEELKAAGGQGRWPRVRDAAADLQAMGDAGVTALLRSLMNGATTDERRGGGPVLGGPQGSPGVPDLRDHPDDDDHVLMRRARAPRL